MVAFIWPAMVPVTSGGSLFAKFNVEVKFIVSPEPIFSAIFLSKTILTPGTMDAILLFEVILLASVALVTTMPTNKPLVLARGIVLLLEPALAAASVALATVRSIKKSVTAPPPVSTRVKVGEN
jgi:hypothetical protein